MPAPSSADRSADAVAGRGRRLRRDGYLRRRARELSRLAVQLTGSADTGAAALVAAAARMPRRGTEARFDQLAARALADASCAGDDVDGQSPRQRAAVVLAIGLGWDAETTAETLHTSTRRARADVAAALAVRPAHEWRRRLDGVPAVALVPPAELPRRAAAARRTRRGRRIRSGVAVGSAATCLVAATTALVRVVTAPAPPPPTATAAQLLHWAARGDLVRDRRFVAEATRLWRRSSRPPSGQVFVLYAGHVGAGRLAVLEGFAGGLPEQEPGTTRPAVAVVGQHRASFGGQALTLDLVLPLTEPQGSVLAVPYDGDPPRRSLAHGTGGRVLQLLAGPDVRAVETRVFGGSGLHGRTSYDRLPLRRGLSAPFVDGPQMLAAVRVTTARGQSAGVLVPGAAQPVAAPASIADAAPHWRGLPHGASAAALLDDLVWSAQLCAGAPATVAPVWSGGAPGFAQIRLEQVGCGGRPTSAQFVTGSGADWQLLAAQPAHGDVYAADVFPEPAGLPTLVLVGSRRVGAVQAGSFRVPGRIAVLPLRVAAHVHVTDTGGRTIPWP